jgi:hypothetical protein
MCKQRYCRPPELSLVTCFLEFAIACGVNFGLLMGAREVYIGSDLDSPKQQTRGSISRELGF